MTSEENNPVLFEDLGLMPALVEATEQMGFQHATSIQANLHSSCVGGERPPGCSTNR